MEFGTGHVIKIQGIVHNHISVPEDAEPLPETLVMTFSENLTSLIEDFDELFDLRYGELFSIRSEAHMRIFFGVIPYWEVIHSSECAKGLVINMDVKESYPIGV